MVLFFFFNDTATTEIYTLSLHDALPICRLLEHCLQLCVIAEQLGDHAPRGGRKGQRTESFVEGDRRLPVGTERRLTVHHVGRGRGGGTVLVLRLQNRTLGRVVGSRRGPISLL